MAYYESCQVGLGARYLLAFDAAMGRSAKLQSAIASSFHLPFASTVYQVFLTTSSIESWIRKLKFWWLPRIVGGQATGWAGFNWSPKTDACGPRVVLALDAFAEVES